MAWTAPATYSVAQIMTAASMNLIRDNLNYLKGNAGTVTIASGVIVQGGGRYEPVGGVSSYLSFYNATSGNESRIQDGGTGAVSEFQIRPGNVLRASFDGTRAYLTDNLGIGTAAPQGKLHGYDSIAGFMHWKYDGVDGTIRVVIPNGTGDVLYRFACLYVARSSGGTTLGGSISAVNPSTTTLLTDGPSGDVLALHANADGSIDVQRTSGTTATFKVSLWLTWL